MPHLHNRATELPWLTRAGDFLPVVHVVGARPGEGLANRDIHVLGFGRMGSRKPIINWKKKGGDVWMQVNGVCTGRKRAAMGPEIVSSSSAGPSRSVGKFLQVMVWSKV